VKVMGEELFKDTKESMILEAGQMIICVFKSRDAILLKEIEADRLLFSNPPVEMDEADGALPAKTAPAKMEEVDGALHTATKKEALRCLERKEATAKVTESRQEKLDDATWNIKMSAAERKGVREEEAERRKAVREEEVETRKAAREAVREEEVETRKAAREEEVETRKAAREAAREEEADVATRNIKMAAERKAAREEETDVATWNFKMAKAKFAQESQEGHRKNELVKIEREACAVCMEAITTDKGRKDLQRISKQIILNIMAGKTDQNAAQIAKRVQVLGVKSRKRSRVATDVKV
jgi:hypothetical protein